MTQQTVTTVVSRDGTDIAVFASGQGPALVLVHGGTADHTRWATVLPQLEPHVSAQAMDRRGRGASGDGPAYALEREFEDVAAVVDAVAGERGEPIDLLGHSFGGACALGAAPLTSNLHRLVVYEPAGASLDEPIAPGLIDRLERLLADGRREELLDTFFREEVGMPEEELAVVRTLPAWQRRIAAAHTIVRELQAIEAYRYDPARIATIAVPTLVLAGGDSPRAVREICDVVAGALPDGHLEVLPGQQHVAMDTAPDLFVRSLLRFLQAA